MLNITIDTTELESLLKLDRTLKEACKNAAEEFSKEVSGHITEQALTKLHSRKDQYIENLYVKKLTDNTWIVGLNQKAVWIEEGTSARSMLKDLLKGRTHRAIPIDDTKGKGGAMTQAQSDLLSTIKMDFEKKKSKKLEDVEYGKDGSPKTGLLHSMNIKSSGTKPGSPSKMPGNTPQGKGQSANTPFLQGVRIYQKVGKGGPGVKPPVKRVIMTFRMASISQEGTGLWDHPGNKPMNFFEEAIDWAKKRWDSDYGPKLLDKVMASI